MVIFMLVQQLNLQQLQQQQKYFCLINGNNNNITQQQPILLQQQHFRTVTKFLNFSILNFHSLLRQKTGNPYLTISNGRNQISIDQSTNAKPSENKQKSQFLSFFCPFVPNKQKSEKISFLEETNATFGIQSKPLYVIAVNVISNSVINILKISFTTINYKINITD